MSNTHVIEELSAIFIEKLISVQNGTKMFIFKLPYQREIKANNVKHTQFVHIVWIHIKMYKECCLLFEYNNSLRHTLERTQINKWLAFNNVSDINRLYYWFFFSFKRVENMEIKRYLCSLFICSSTWIQK